MRRSAGRERRYTCRVRADRIELSGVAPLLDASPGSTDGLFAEQVRVAEHDMLECIIFEAHFDERCVPLCFPRASDRAFNHADDAVTVKHLSGTHCAGFLATHDAQDFFVGVYGFKRLALRIRFCSIRFGGVVRHAPWPAEPDLLDRAQYSSWQRSRTFRVCRCF